MAFLILEGIDRTGKTTVSKIYQDLGYKYVHFSAPDKKYSQPGYVGPSYLEDLIEFLVGLSGQDVVFDRSWYGELVWPYIYGRNPLLSAEDLEILIDIENQNSTQRILLVDSNIEAHWQRCVDNKEPLTVSQFKSAYNLYTNIAKTYNFVIKTKDDFENPKETQEVKHEIKIQEEPHETTNVVQIETSVKLTPEQLKLQQANAVNEILSSRIVRKKGPEFEIIESKIRDFLNKELALLLGTNNQQTQIFSEEEIVLLKALANRVKDKRA